MTREQKKATRKALRRYAEGPVCAGWKDAIRQTLRYYDAADPVCSALLRQRYLDGLPEDRVVQALYISRSTYYRKELEVLSTVAIEAAKRGVL